MPASSNSGWAAGPPAPAAPDDASQQRYRDTIAGNGTAGFAGDGSPATGAQLSAPAAVRLDRAGNLLIADTGNGRIRVVAEVARRLPGVAPDTY